ncbi:MAG: hypothetical protein GX456_00340 [Verrucomicrobia bacterium]|nr:hypothetical protein [Verrucomicrobiota bacterium]
MGVGRREALGVRQLAAALCLCANNVSVPMSACAGFLHQVQGPRIGTGEHLWGIAQSARSANLRRKCAVATQTSAASAHLRGVAQAGRGKSGFGTPIAHWAAGRASAC